MTQLQDVRKFIQKGDRAVQLLESLGYTYLIDNKSEPRWVEPAQVDPKEALAKFLRDQADALSPQTKFTWSVSAQSLFRTSGEPPIPAGRRFTVEPRRIPTWHRLSKYSDVHFRGMRFEVIRCFQPKTDTFPIGWAVEFRMSTSPFESENVWLPLSACAFH